MSFRILGTGSALPEMVLTNDDLTTFLDTSDEWMRTRTGIQRRHILSGSETITGLAVDAANRALENAGIGPEEIDFVVGCTIGGDFITPSLACLVQGGIGANCPATDVVNGCAGFVYTLEVAAGILARGKAKKVLVVAGEGLSRVADWADRSTCVLFGDGAAAVVLGQGDDLLAMNLTSAGWYEPLYVPYPISPRPPQLGEWNPGPVHFQPPYLQMNGGEVYKFAVNAIAKGCRLVLEEAGLETGDVDHLLLHQANLRIIEAAVKKLGIPMEKCPVSIMETGNNSGVTLPMLMDMENRAGHFAKGDILVLSAFGAGLATGSAVIRWAKG